jgi:nucleoside transporter
MSGEAHRDAGDAIGTRLSVMMFLQFFVWGAWYVTVGNYMKEHGMADGIANAYSVGPLAAIISPFFLGMVADRFFATERVLGVMHVLGGLALLAAPMAPPQLFVPVLLLHMLCYMPTLGLTNTLSFHNMTDQEKQFPLIRVFGTIGWIVANIVVSKMLHADTAPSQFYVAGGASLLLGIYSFTLPHTPAPSAGKKATARDILGLDSLALMRSPSFAVFMISSFLICIPLAAYYSFAPVFVGDMGFTDPAFNMSFGQMSEILFMLVMPLCFARLGVKWMLVIGMLAWVVRYGLFAGAASSGAMWMVLGGIILHGICYDFFFVTGQIYVDKKAPVSIRGQAQGFLVLVTQGLGMLIGAQVAGQIVAANTPSEGAENWQNIWIIPCIAATAIMVLFFALFREEDKPATERDAERFDGPVELGPVT